MCGVEGKRELCDLNVTSLSPALATRHIRSLLLVNSPNKLNLLSWLRSIYVINKVPCTKLLRTEIIQIKSQIYFNKICI